MSRYAGSVSVARFMMVSLALALPAARADEDPIEGPWGTVHGDLAGTASTTGIPYELGAGPLEEKWRLDVVAEGHDRAGGRASIVFDAAGNLYWITSSAGGTEGVIRLVSVSPEGEIRWAGNDGAGNVHALGTVFSGASPVVGVARVYGIGDRDGMLMVAAYDKETGANLWETSLPPSVAANGNMLTPVLYQGKLYAVGVSDELTRDVHCVDAETGAPEWSSTVSDVEISTSMNGQMAFVPDAFGEGAHGVYYNGDSGGGTDGLSEVYGVVVDTVNAEASLGWSSEGGKVARSHVIYSAADNLLYTLTWSDYGAQLYIFDPEEGFLGAHQNSRNTGHGFYDVGALDFDGQTIIAGGFDGLILRYSPADDGTASDEILLQGGSALDTRYWGETRVLGQLLQDPDGNSVLITATNSLEGCGSHVVAVDVTQREILWEHDTGNIWPHNFQYAGGPVMGPDGKIYFFERRDAARLPLDAPNNTLVALGPAESAPPPTAGFLLTGFGGREVTGAAPDQCAQTDEIVDIDAGCSTGDELSYTFSVEPADDATVTHESAADPLASVRFHVAGTYTLSLAVESASGTAEYSREVCVVDVAPVCALTLTDAAGGAIDDTDDDDEVLCLPAGRQAIVDASASFGGELDFEFTVDPEEGVELEFLEDPTLGLRFSTPGTYTVSVSLVNDLGMAECGPVTICVTEAVGGLQLPGDIDQNGALELTDAVNVLGHLFLGMPANLPCEGGNAANPGPGALALLDVNSSGAIDLSDSVFILAYLFTGSNQPPLLGTECTEIMGCADSPGCAP